MAKSKAEKFDRIFVVGNGVYARTLAHVLGAYWIVSESSPDTAIGIDAPATGGRSTAVVVPASNDTGSTVVRRHRDLWPRIPGEALAWIIVAENEQQRIEIRNQDVYGRADGTETFGAESWRKRYAILSRVCRLSTVLNHRRALMPMMRSTWERSDVGAATIQELLRRIEAAITGNPGSPVAQLTRGLPFLVWECFCDHAHANKIRDWMSRDKQCTAWLLEGRQLLMELGYENK
jgi:hypothetical protein